MYRKPVSTLRPHLHLPLKRLALCLDCEECFELGAEACPACGSGTWTTLALFLDGGQPSAEFTGARVSHAA
jgi:RNA polymerase subunit RPABC4/transcription elongation factor Spt4